MDGPVLEMPTISGTPLNGSTLNTHVAPSNEQRSHVVADEGEQRFVLPDMTYPMYVMVSDGIGERRTRVTFDGSTVELMSLSNPHEYWKTFLTSVIETLFEEFEIEASVFGSFTHRREDIERGFEPDCCFYSKGLDVLQRRIEIDLSVDPPPDLALEIEVSRSIIDRLAICAAFGIPELWRWRDGSLIVMVLQTDGQYRVVERSPTFPLVPIEPLSELLLEQGGKGIVSVKRTLRKWIKQHCVLPIRDPN